MRGTNSRFADGSEKSGHGGSLRSVGTDRFELAS
jgi:hypothetical protein